MLAAVSPTQSTFPRPTCVGYCRVSTAEQAQHGWSIEQQEESIRNWADIQGLQLLGMFRDAGRSGQTMQRRPGLLGLLELVRQRGVGVVVVKAQDRLARAVDHALALRRWFHQHDADVLFLDGSIHLRATTSSIGGDLGTSLIASLSAVLAEEEVATLRRRILPSLAAAARAGRRGGRLPLGYQRDAGGSIVVEPHDAAIVKRVVGFLRGGDGLSQVGRRLVAEQVRDSQGRMISFDRLRGALTSRFLLGDFAYTLPVDASHDGSQSVEIRNHHPAILDPVSFGEVQLLLRARSRSRPAEGQPRNQRSERRRRQRRANRLPASGDVLAAITPAVRPAHGAIPPEALRCAHCGGPMYASLQTVGGVGKRRKQAVYLCRYHKDRGMAFCPQPPVRCDDVDDVVAAALMTWLRNTALDAPTGRAGTDAPQNASAVADLQAAAAERDRLLLAIARFVDRAAPPLLRERLATAEATVLRLTHLAQRAAGAQSQPQGAAWEFRRLPQATWDALDHAGRRAVIQPLLAQVRIKDKAVTQISVRDDAGLVHQICGAAVDGADP